MGGTVVGSNPLDNNHRQNRASKEVDNNFA
jgi:hypothetical protein